jgi:hypothetical protein
LKVEDKYFVFIDSWHGDVIMDDLPDQEWRRRNGLVTNIFIDIVIHNFGIVKPIVWTYIRLI